MDYKRLYDEKVQENKRRCPKCGSIYTNFFESIPYCSPTDQSPHIQVCTDCGYKFELWD